MISVFNLASICLVLCNFNFRLAICLEDELYGVVAIFRHGDRTPIRPYPTDPYKNRSFWPVNFGQLTNDGKRQEYELGKYLRQRYNSYLPRNYDNNDIRVVSTDVDRTLMSAASNLAGLYPPLNNETFEPNLPWQPIPIHTIPELIDNVLAAKKPCPKYDYLFKSLLQTPYFRNITKQIHDLYAYLSRYSGEIINSLETVEYLYNTFFIETRHNLTLPDWALKVYPQKLEKWAFLSFATATFTPELARFKVGPLFYEIFEYFYNRTQNIKSPKIVLYSGHDVTIANILNSIDSFDYHAPPYASTIIFELYKNISNSEFYIKTFYKNSTIPQQIEINHCGSTCNLDDAVARLQNIVLTKETWEVECSSGLFTLPLDTVTVILAAVVIFVIFVLVVTVTYGKCCKRNKKRYSPFHQTFKITVFQESY